MSRSTPNAHPSPGWLQSHGMTFACLLPFAVMLLVHRALNLSDALMVATPPGQREAHTYNLVMMGAWIAGSSAYLVHTLLVWRRSIGWLAFKLALAYASMWAPYLIGERS